MIVLFRDVLTCIFPVLSFLAIYVQGTIRNVLLYFKEGKYNNTFLIVLSMLKTATVHRKDWNIPAYGNIYGELTFKNILISISA